MVKEKVNKALEKAKEIHSKDCLNKISSISGEMKKRILSAIILIPIVLIFIYSSEITFSFLIVIIAIVMSMEWVDIINKKEANVNWRAWGILYIAIPCLSLIYIRSINNGDDIILWLFSVIWTTDSCAMFAGKNFKGPKLAPSISPNKTWSGLLGGCLGAMLIGLIASIGFQGGVIFFMSLSAVLAVIEQAGDLLESKIKRYFEIKDSGTIIPGHGGILDRVDGFIFASLVIALMVKFSSKIF